MKTSIMHRGIAMIELIFAIVIMGIVMMSAPMLISNAGNSGYAAIQQEGINEAASQINIILGYAWDEGNTIAGRTPVIFKTDSDNNLSEKGSTGKRAGTPEDSFRTFIDSNATRHSASSTLGGDGAADTEIDDIDDFNGNTILKEIELAEDADYVEREANIAIVSTIGYIEDNASGGNYLDPSADKKITFAPNFATAAIGRSNIKKISVTLTSTSGVDELNKTIVLHAFSCNIGEYKLEEE